MPWQSDAIGQMRLLSKVRSYPWCPRHHSDRCHHHRSRPKIDPPWPDQSHHLKIHHRHCTSNGDCDWNYDRTYPNVVIVKTLAVVDKSIRIVRHDPLQWSMKKLWRDWDSNVSYVVVSWLVLDNHQWNLSWILYCGVIRVSGRSYSCYYCCCCCESNYDCCYQYYYYCCCCYYSCILWMIAPRWQQLLPQRPQWRCHPRYCCSCWRKRESHSERQTEWPWCVLKW